MYVEVVAIEQRMSLQTKKTQNYLRLRMPNADELIVEVPEDDLMRVLKANQDNDENTKKADEDHISIAKPEPESALAQEPINWADLTDEVLPAYVKAEFARLGLPEVMTVVEITSYAHQVMAAATEMPATPAGKVVPLRPEPVQDFDDVTGIPQI